MFGKTSIFGYVQKKVKQKNNLVHKGLKKIKISKLN